MKTTAVTGQFGEPVRTLEDLRTAMASRAARAAEKIRAKGLVASRLIGFAKSPAGIAIGAAITPNE